MRSKNFYLIIQLLLFTAAGVFSYFQFEKPVSPENTANVISDAVNAVFKAVDEEAKAIVSKKKSEVNADAKFQFIVLKNEQIISWSDHHFVPPVSAISDDFTVKFLKLGSGEFLAKKWKVDDGQSLVALIPLHIQYKINNGYLTPFWNTEIFRTSPSSILEPESSEGYPVQLDSQVVFKISWPESMENSGWGYLNVLFISVAIGIAIFLLLKTAKDGFIKYPAFSFIILVVMAFVVRRFMIYVEFPSRFIQSPLFDPQVFASSEFNPSLADLIINAVVVFALCMYLFRTYYRFHLFKAAIASSTLAKWALSIFSVLAVLFTTLFGYVVVQTIYNNSAISLSIAESLDVDTLRVVAFASLIFCWLSSFLFIHVFARLLMFDNNYTRIVGSIIGGSVFFTAINLYTGQYFTSSLLIGVLYLCSIIFLRLYRGFQSLTYLTFLYFFVTVLAFSVNDVIAVQHYEQKRKAISQVRFANNFLIERDYFAEYLLQEASTRIANDAFVQMRMSTPILGKEIIRQKINQVFLSGYFNRYNLNVRLYNSSGESLESTADSTFSDLLYLYDKEAYKTEYKNIYFVANEAGDFARKYVALIPIMKVGANVGHIVIELSLKRIIPENVYPELLVDSRFQRGDKEDTFSYAITDRDSIQYSAGDFNYSSFVKQNLGNTLLYKEGIVVENHLHVAIEDSNSKIAIVSSLVRSLKDGLSDFSLQVIMGMSVVLLFLIITGFIDYSRAHNLYLAARIQLVLNLAIFLPLVAVSIITLTITTRSSQLQLQDEYLTKTKRFALTMAEALDKNKDREQFESVFASITSLANLDANLFSLEGRLQSTSQPLIFENYLLSSYVDPSVLERIRKGDRSFISTEQVGNLEFNVSYSALISPESGAPIGILGIPFFRSAASLEQLQISLFTNILSIFTLIFIVLLLISFVVTKWLTDPLRLITKTIGRLSLTSENAPLEWKSDDEIGLMIKEYNQMLEKLQESKLQLERNQRELAWREIAQQVAHEIKNPLTPMKLTLQQLERTLEKDSTASEKFAKAVHSLLVQVNSLDAIASSFSSFAKMPEPILTTVNLHALLVKLTNLHGHEGEVILESKTIVANVLADEKLVSRIFSNIILNGLQASHQDETPRVMITLEQVGTALRISFTDNGVGIDKSWEDKIFIPHFTTKQSGSGLGLAIAKQGIEQLGGKIWFETSSKGTTFFIELLAIQ